MNSFGNNRIIEHIETSTAFGGLLCLTRMKSHIEEQENWIYDTEYDYRKYWFETLLFLVKRILNEKEYAKQVLEQGISRDPFERVL